ncbi:MAG: 3-phosphoglycerate dehydrogenase [Lachnospiraceae bacterium]
MYNYHCLNAISEVGLKEFSADYVKVEAINDAEAVLVRSAAMHDMDLPKGLKAIARAGAGVNNIPLDKCAEAGTVVFNTPGANANAVKELVLTGMLIANRNVVPAVNWVQSIKDQEGVGPAVEKGKKQFVGHEISGKTLGIIGLGAIGFKVAQSAAALGMKIVGYDAFPLSPEKKSALPEGTVIVNEIDELYADADFITVHVPLMDSTKEMFNKESFAKMKDGVVLLNFSRDKLVRDADMKEALTSGKVFRYVTDFPNDVTAGMEGVIATPHLGASTEEAEENCAAMAVQEVREFFEKGNLVHPVNFPGLEMERSGKTRVCVLFKGASIKDAVTKELTGKGITVKASKEAVKGDFGYCVLDCDEDVACDAVTKSEAVLRVMIVK